MIPRPFFYSSGGGYSPREEQEETKKRQKRPDLEIVFGDIIKENSEKLKIKWPFKIDLEKLYLNGANLSDINLAENAGLTGAFNGAAAKTLMRGGTTALIYAMKGSSIEIAKALIEAGADINTGGKHDKYCNDSQCQERRQREAELRMYGLSAEEIDATLKSSMSNKEWEQFKETAQENQERDKIKQEGAAYLQELRMQADELSDLEKEEPWTFQNENLARAGNIILQGAEAILVDRDYRALVKNEGEKRLLVQDQSGQDQSGQDFSGWNLQKAQLQGATLQDTILIGAQLQGAQLQGSNLRGACFWDAKLSGTDLEYADLTMADLRNADLQGAQNLTVQQLAVAIVDKTTKLPAGISLEAIKFARRADLVISTQQEPEVRSQEVTLPTEIFPYPNSSPPAPSP